MKLKLLAAVTSTALMAFPTVAQADDEGWYLRGNVGYGAHTDTDLSGFMIGDTQSEGNVGASLGLGYETGNNWRVEFDTTSLWTDMGKIDNVPSSFSKLRTNTYMLNAIYDFEDFGQWEPYLGAGIGVVNGHASAQAHDFISNSARISNPVCVNGSECYVRDSDKSFAWQLLAGLSYDISDNLSWDNHYKYQNFDTLTFNGLQDGNKGIMRLEDLGAHLLMTGLRYRFGGSTPTPMITCWDGSEVKMVGNCPAEPKPMVTCWDGSQVESASACPAEPKPMVTCWDGSQVESASACPAEPKPMVTCWDGSVVSDASFCPAETRSGVTTASLCANQYRQEIIYYEFNKGQSAETRNTINRILDIGEFCRVDNIRVVGHTDTSGAASYNLALSKRRAKDARDELVRQGINSAVISSEGKGETEPFVQTGDGVKEQLNRRTEVLITLSEVGAIVN